ncbi:MAG: O-antigen ligase family protein [Candidatus Latescibacterota bacterium]|nr:MAG: O-antigen ligase family protein [Candidatus Latescibacterota bacterium]
MDLSKRQLSHATAPAASLPSDRAGRALGIALLAMLYAVPLTVTWSVAGVHIAIGVAFFLVLVHGLWRRAWPLARTDADLGFAAYALAACIAVLFAVDATSDPIPLKKLALIPLAHVAAAVFMHSHRARTALRLFVFAMAATTLVASIEFLLWREGRERLQATSHYMTFSGLMILALPMAATAAAIGPRRPRLAYAAAALVLGGGLLLTFTRGAWIGIVVGLCAVIARLRRRLLLFVPPVLLLLFLALPSEFQDRALSSFDLSFGPNADRIQMWRVGMSMWRENPWTGVGLGDLQVIYNDHVANAAEDARVYGHLHNIWLQVLASMGLLGLVAFAWLIFSIGRIFWRGGARSRDPELRALAMGAWGSFCAFLTMGLFEWNFGDVEVTITLYWFVGVLQALAGTGTTSCSPTRPVRTSSKSAS